MLGLLISWAIDLAALGLARAPARLVDLLLARLAHLARPRLALRHFARRFVSEHTSRQHATHLKKM